MIYFRCYVYGVERFNVSCNPKDKNGDVLKLDSDAMEIVIHMAKQKVIERVSSILKIPREEIELRRIPNDELDKKDIESEGE